MVGLYGDRPNLDPEIKIVDVYVCKARKKLKGFGVEIETVWGRGYRLSAECKAIAQGLLEPGEGRMTQLAAYDRARTRWPRPAWSAGAGDPGAVRACQAARQAGARSRAAGGCDRVPDARGAAARRDAADALQQAGCSEGRPAQGGRCRAGDARGDRRRPRSCRRRRRRRPGCRATSSRRWPGHARQDQERPCHPGRPDRRQGIIHGARSIMSSRVEPDDSLDYFPTPPFATRALLELVLQASQDALRNASAREPACGEGHIAEVLTEYFAPGLGLRHLRLRLWRGRRFPRRAHQPDRGLVHHQSAVRREGRGVPDCGCSRSPASASPCSSACNGWKARGATSGSSRRCRRRWSPSSASASRCARAAGIPKAAPPRPISGWSGSRAAQPQAPFWIPPICKDTLTRPDDVERFTEHPVRRRVA
jgi:hypothetical protein